MSTSAIDLPAIASGDDVPKETEKPKYLSEKARETEDAQQFYDQKLKLFSCPWCDESFQYPGRFNNHRKLAHLWGRFACPECFTYFDLLKDLISTCVSQVSLQFLVKR